MINQNTIDGIKKSIDKIEEMKERVEAERLQILAEKEAEE